MRFDTRQQMRLGQQMKLAPHMIQSMEILQLPLPLLQERIDQELETNVALELAGPEEDSSREDAPSSESQTESDAEQPDGAEGFDRLADMERGYREVWDSDDYAGARARPTGERDGKMDALANTVKEYETRRAKLAEAEGESAKGQAAHRSTMGARARRLSHGVHASAITQGGTCIRGKGTSSDPGSCWRASKGVAGDAGIGGDEGDTASWGGGGSDRNATVMSTDSAHKALLPLRTA